MIARRLALALGGTALLRPGLGLAADGERLRGIPALPGGRSQVAATLHVGAAEADGVRILEVAMLPAGGSKPITRYDVELSKQLHLIAVSEDLTTFLHEHAERPGADGVFTVRMAFPRGGLWHVYADAVPTGLGQQVARFGVRLDDTASAARPGTTTAPSGSDGRYGARLDRVPLRAGQEAAIGLHLLRDGRPAPDLAPYLGVAAHAVFVSVAELTYVHAHAMAGGGGAHGGHGMAGRMATVSPDLVVHMTPPKAGLYALWVQFMGGGQVRTVPFVVEVG